MMITNYFGVFLVWCLIISSPSLSDDSAADQYIIHMDPEGVPKPFSSSQHYFSSLLININSEPAIYSYTNSMHGFSARLSPKELEAIKRSPGYLSATKDVKLKLTTTHSTEFLGLNSLSGVWPASNFGQDVIIGVVDTGIWPESKSFSDDGMVGFEIPRRWKGGCYGGIRFNSTLCNKKLIGARFFNKGMKRANPNDSSITDSARDFSGHGTHVSSIAAGNYIQGANYYGYGTGTAKGVSPRAQLAMYKVGYTLEEGIHSSDIIAAIDSAIADGVGILSLSIGSGGDLLYDDPIAVATFSATVKGIFVSQAAGNSGPSLMTISSSGSPWNLIVGASSLDREFRGTIVLGNGVCITGSTLYPLDDPVSVSSPLPIVSINDCSSHDKKFASRGKIVICKAKANESEQDDEFPLAENFKDTGVAAAVIILDVLDLPPAIEVGFPAIFINKANGQVILDYINGNDAAATATVTFRETVHGSKPAPKVADYSSRGPSQSYPLILKPDVIAPGDSIIASWQEETPTNPLTTGGKINKFKVASGTSMAAPHAAGIAALLKGANPDWSPAAIRSAIITTADFLDNTMNPIKEQGSNVVATPLAMGAGQINPNKAVDPGLVYDADEHDYVNFVCALNLTVQQTRAILIATSYNCSNSSSSDLNYPSFIALFGNKTTSNGTLVRKFERTVTNVGDNSTSYKVQVTAPIGSDITVSPTTLAFGKRYEKQSYSLTIRYNHNAGVNVNGTITFGSIKWVEDNGKHTVRSPIVVSPMIRVW